MRRRLRFVCVCACVKRYEEMVVAFQHAQDRGFDPSSDI
uniref:Uncharacterized protein n=1 Tax=Peronospora matthiolae TaxID=2874970 RepID=A0AAV1T7K7_9STRA